MKSFKWTSYFSVVILLMIVFVFFGFVSQTRALQPLITNNVENGDHFGVCITSGDCNLCDFLKIFIRGSDIITGLGGVLAVVMFVYGGFIMIMAYGNEARVKWGKEVLVATVVGIFIMMLAWTLVNVIILSLYGGTMNDGVFQKITGSPTWNACPSPTPNSAPAKP